ncbi:hypothetical protein HMPREF0659_A7260 [Prevotella melaninogenica ATCC 25845]|nr:hypothetical protein HMPREF0659_A7260 [Prevotella melaninogenica ATCC 25845]
MSCANQSSRMSISSDMLGKELFFANIKYSCELRKRKLLSFEH